MPDREKVIKALEHCSEDGCEGCPYEPECLMADGFSELARDALELLKEQEAKSAIIEGSDVAHVGRCPSCHVILTPFRANYCYCCGKAVKWNADDRR